MPKGYRSIHATTSNVTAKDRDIAEQREEAFKSLIASIKPPSWLNDNLKDKFNWYTSQMHDLGILTILDADILAQYVYYQDRFLQLHSLIEKNGYETADGRISPFIVEQRQVRGLLDRMEIKLGFNPTDRLRFMQQETAEVDELGAFKNEL